MTYKEFGEVFVPLADHFNASLSKNSIMLYFDMLKRYSKDELLRARTEILATRKYPSMPQIAEFIEILEGTEQDKSIKALEDLEYAINAFGQYKSVAFKDGAIMRAVEHIGGWIKVCTASEDEYKWLKKDFINAYKTFSKIGGAPTHLKGICEKENGFKGIPTNESIGLIGFKQSEASLISFIEKTQPPKEITRLLSK